MKGLLSNTVKLIVVQAQLADGQTDPNSTAVDMSGFDGVMFVVLCGTITGSGTVEVHAQQSSDNGSADAFADISGATKTATSSTKSDLLLVLDIYQPAERYVRYAMTRAVANSIIGGGIAIQYAAKDKAAATATAQLAATIYQGVNPTE